MNAESKNLRGRLLRFNEPSGSRLVELATGHGLSVAEYFDREFGDLIADRWRAMLEAKLRGADPAFANSLESEAQ